MLLLTKFSLENENFSENKNLPRVVGSNEDYLCMLIICIEIWIKFLIKMLKL